MRRLITALAFFAFSHSAFCSPWIGTNDKQLHHDLQILVEWGYLDAAMTSYPIPWKGIIPQLNKLSEQTLPALPDLSLRRLLHFARQYQNQESMQLARMYLSNEESRFSGFNGIQGENAQLQISKEGYYGRWSGKLSANLTSGGKRNFDQSYVAYQFGDWNIRAGAIDQWWGPANGSSLILTDNARPLPAIAFSKSTATASKSAWLSWLGPWYFTTQLGVMEKQRHIPKTRQWLSRVNFRPLKGLEVGLSWTAMWGGEGLNNSLSALFDVITAKSSCPATRPNCTDAQKSKLGNQLAGIDLSYNFILMQRPVRIYAQRIGEDGSAKFKPSDNATLLGISSYVGNTKLYAEHSNTVVSCGGGDSTIANCYYEHGTYKSGYRRYGRAIGSTYDSDAKVLLLGSITHFNNGDVMQFNASKLTLNADGERPSPVLSGNSENTYQFSGFYRTSIDSWQVKLGAQVERRSVDKMSTDWDGLIYTEVQYAWP